MGLSSGTPAGPKTFQLSCGAFGAFTEVRTNTFGKDGKSCKPVVCGMPPKQDHATIDTTKEKAAEREVPMTRRETRSPAGGPAALGGASAR